MLPYLMRPGWRKVRCAVGCGKIRDVRERDHTFCGRIHLITEVLLVLLPCLAVCLGCQEAGNALLLKFEALLVIVAQVGHGMFRATLLKSKNRLRLLEPIS